MNRDIKKGAMQVCGRKMFQRGGIINAKSLEIGVNLACSRKSKKLVWLEQIKKCRKIED